MVRESKLYDSEISFFELDISGMILNGFAGRSRNMMIGLESAVKSLACFSDADSDRLS